MSDHFYWIWIIFLIFPLVRLIQRYFKKRSRQDFSRSTEIRPEIQLENRPTEVLEKPMRNFAREETKDMLVLGKICGGIKKFAYIQKDTGLGRDELISILDDLEKEGLVRVDQKSGMLGPQVELFVTDKGFKKYYS